MVNSSIASSASSAFSAVKYLIVLAIIAPAIGCADGSDGVSVAGRVVYQDQPITSGALTFFPADGRPITATLSGDGKYECVLPPGEYRVAITVGVSLPAGWKEGDPVPPNAINLPAKYASRLESPLTATVKADHDAPIDFALK